MSGKAWVATKACGCLAAMVADGYLTAEHMRDWGKRGLTARLVPSEEIGTIPLRCPAHRKDAQRDMFAEQQAGGAA